MPRSLPRKTRLFAGACAILIASFTAARGEDAEGVVLAESFFPELEGIIDRALSQSPRMISQNLDRLSAQYDADAVRASLYPNASGYLQYNYQKDDRLQITDAGGTVESDLINNKAYYSFSISQPVFHWGAIKNRVEIGKIQAEIAASNFESAYRQLAVEIRNAYQRLIISKVGLRNLDLDISLEQRRIEGLRQRVAEGRETSSQIGVSELALDERLLARERAQRSYERDIETFRRLTGADDFPPESIPESIPAVPDLSVGMFAPYRDEYVTRNGYEKTAGFLVAERNLDVARLYLEIERTSLRPKLNLQVGVLQDEQTYTKDLTDQYRVTSVYAGVVLNWNIFDSFASRSRTRAALLRLEKLEKNLALMRADLQRTAENAAEDLDFATRALRIAETRFGWTAGSLKRMRELHAEGRVSQDAVDASVAAYQREELNIYVARAGYLNAVAAFLSSVNADPLIEKKMREGKLTH